MKKVLFLQNRSWMALAALVVMIAGFVSCNKEFKNTLPELSAEDTAALNLGTRKALVILLDGAVGAEVRNLAPHNLTLLSDFSVYSYDALADYKSTEPMTRERGWANILTGVNAVKHGVDQSSMAGNHFDMYPSIISRFSQLKPEWETAAFGASASFIDTLAADATQRQSFNGDDAAVKDAVISSLQNDNAVLTLAQFSLIDEAGQAGSYSSADEGYKNAILQADEYIGEILAALRGRENFESENWLVIIASGNGSAIADNPAAAANNAYQDSRRNTLLFIYNPRFRSEGHLKPGTQIPYIGNAPLYAGHDEDSYSQVLNDDGLFDFGDQGSYTIQCKVKIPSGSYYYPAIIGKRESFGGGVPGWVFFLEGNLWQINFGQSGQGNTQVKGQPIMDDKWHTLTAVISQEGTDRMVYTYTDGVFSGNSANISGKGNINSPAPLTVGYIPGSRFGGGYTPNDYFITDIRIYNEALPAEYIAVNYCAVNVPSDDPYFDNLLGYWPSVSVTGDQELEDFSGNDHNMTVSQLNAVSFSDITNTVCPEINEEVYRIVPNSVDIANQLLGWYGILIPKDWKLDGKSWIPSFIDLEN